MSAEYPYSQHSITFHHVYTDTKSEYGAHRVYYRPANLDRVGMLMTLSYQARRAAALQFGDVEKEGVW